MRKIGFKIDENLKNEKINKKIIVPQDFRHALCVGSTGSGKTASIILPTIKNRIESGEALLIYIYKGHEDKKIKHIANKNNRIEDIIEIGKPYGMYINLLSYLDDERVSSALFSLIGENGNDPYWSLSASKIGTLIVKVLRKINILTNLFEYKNITSLRMMNGKENRSFEEKQYQYPKEEPSFKTLLKIINNNKEFNNFFLFLPELVKKIEKTLEIDAAIDNSLNKKEILIHLIELEELIETYGEILIDEDGKESGGNNGVVEILNNALYSIASKDYLNNNDLNLFQKLENNAIVIIDIESLGETIHGVFLNSILSKLAARIRLGEPKKISIFIDEANRVLSDTTDIHEDVLRESNVELILAIQNESQMNIKFGSEKWKSIKNNLLHKYEINSEHEIFYKNNIYKNPYFIKYTDEELIKTEYKFNNLKIQKDILNKKFEIVNKIPNEFQIIYDINSFEIDKTIKLIDKNNNSFNAIYLGKKMKEKLENKLNHLDLIKKRKC